MAKFKPELPRNEQTLTPRERTFVNRFDNPKRDDIPAEVIEHTTDEQAARKSFREAGTNYTHRIGVVIYTEEEFDYYTKPAPKSKKKESKDEQQEESGARFSNDV